MNSKILIKLNYEDYNDLVKLCFNKKINIIKTNISNRNCYILINKKDYKLLNIYFNIKIVKEYSFKNLKSMIFKNYKSIIIVLVSTILFLALKNVVIDVKIINSNENLNKELSKSLENYGIKRLTLKKDYIKLKEIKEEISKEYKEKIEWIEIESTGMNYIIKLEERKKIDSQVDENFCDIISSSSGIISKIISKKGEVAVDNNDFVKEGDILISGEVKLNDEVKESICAKGDVYAQKWYNITIKLPSNYEKKKYTKKTRYNLEFDLNNKEYKIFKSRFKKYDTDKKDIITLLNNKIVLLKEYEYTNNNYLYDDKAIDEKIDEIIYKKLELNLNNKERIISKNILKKEEINSKINIEIFVVVEKLISKQIVHN